jgi:hypothetical protein
MGSRQCSCGRTDGGPSFPPRRNRVRGRIDLAIGYHYPDDLAAVVPKYVLQLPTEPADRPISYARVGDGYRLSNIPATQHGTTSFDMFVEVAR